MRTRFEFGRGYQLRPVAWCEASLSMMPPAVSSTARVANQCTWCSWTNAAPFKRRYYGFESRRVCHLWGVVAAVAGFNNVRDTRAPRTSLFGWITGLGSGRSRKPHDGESGCSSILASILQSGLVLREATLPCKERLRVQLPTGPPIASFVLH